MKVKSVTAVGRKPVYDVTVKSDNYDDQHYVLENGVITHNTGVYYAADNIYILGRQQEKDGTEITGYNFIINVEKSRYVKEKSKIPVSVSFEGGINKYSGLLDVALEGNFVVKPSNGWYSKVDPTTGEVEEKKYRYADTQNADFMEPLLKNKAFQEYVRKRYEIAYGSIMGETAVLEETEDA